MLIDIGLLLHTQVNRYPGRYLRYTQVKQLQVPYSPRYHRANANKGLKDKWGQIWGLALNMATERF